MRIDLASARAHVPAPVLTRFAPSPTGYLHLGHVVNAIYVWGLAAALGGEVQLRIEDHDRIRCRPEYEPALLEDLTWLGFIDGPRSRACERQQDRDAVYAEALGRLRTVAPVYACDCSRASYSGERYPGRCRDRGLAEGPGRGLRVQFASGVEQARDLGLGELIQVPAEQCGDLLLRDRHGQWTYQFAVTVDDLEAGVSLVVRGQDLVSSTGRQVRLGRLLRSAGLGASSWPPAYVHHPLITGADGQKLSKSAGSTGVRELRAAGLGAGDVLGRAAAAIGLVDDKTRLAMADLQRVVSVASG